MQKFHCFCGLLSMSSLLLLGQAVLPEAYRKSLCFSDFFNFSSCLLHSCIRSHLKVDKYAFCYTMLFAYFITFNLKPMIYKILICALNIPRTNLFSVYSLSVSATVQLVQGRMQLSVSLQR